MGVVLLYFVLLNALAPIPAWVPAGPPCRASPATSSRPRHSAARHCDAPKPLKTYVSEIRTAKAALRRGLEAEGGVLSEDGLAVALGLAQLNPTAPDPAADTDLWQGKEFALLSSALPLLGAPGPLLRQGDAKLRVEAGQAVLEVLVFEGPVGVGELLGQAGESDADYAVAKADVALRMDFERSGDDQLIVRVASASLRVRGRPNSAAIAGVVFASTQTGSSWALAPGSAPNDPEAERVLERPEGAPLAEARISMLFLDQVRAFTLLSAHSLSVHTAPTHTSIHTTLTQPVTQPATEPAAEPVIKLVTRHAPHPTRPLTPPSTPGSRHSRLGRRGRGGGRSGLCSRLRPLRAEQQRRTGRGHVEGRGPARDVGGGGTRTLPARCSAQAGSSLILCCVAGAGCAPWATWRKRRASRRRHDGTSTTISL